MKEFFWGRNENRGLKMRKNSPLMSFELKKFVEKFDFMGKNKL